MENLRNFIGNVMTPKGNNDNATGDRSAKLPQQTKASYNTNYGKPPIRSRTDSECSNASTSSMDSNGGGRSQADKDSYFWVMWVSFTLRNFLVTREYVIEISFSCQTIRPLRCIIRVVASWFYLRWNIPSSEFAHSSAEKHSLREMNYCSNIFLWAK